MLRHSAIPRPANEDGGRDSRRLADNSCGGLLAMATKSQAGTCKGARSTGLHAAASGLGWLKWSTPVGRPALSGNRSPCVQDLVVHHHESYGRALANATPRLGNAVVETLLFLLLVRAGLCHCLLSTQQLWPRFDCRTVNIVPYLVGPAT